MSDSKIPLAIVITIVLAISAGLATYFTAQAGAQVNIQTNTARIDSLEKTMIRILDKLDTIESLLRPNAK